MKNFVQCVFIEPGKNSVNILDHALLKRFYPKLKHPDFSRVIIEDIDVKQISSDRADVFSVHIDRLPKLQKMIDPNGADCLAIAMPLVALDSSKSKSSDPQPTINDVDLEETSLYKSVAPNSEGMRVIDTDSVLFARLKDANGDIPNDPVQVNEFVFSNLVRTHLLHDTVLDLSKGLTLDLVQHSHLDTKMPEMVTLLIDVTFGLVSVPHS